MTSVKPKKALGQHFLKDLSVARRIAATIDDCAGLPVLEIGPGTGVLTRFLLEAGHDLKVVEIDRESVAYLTDHFPDLEGKIIADDFLRLDLDRIWPGQRFVLIGNYPYCISSQIFFRLLDYKDLIPVCAGMIQKEVAARIASPAGKKAYGILSVLLQTWFDIEYLFTVDEQVFDPPPKVKSAVIRLTRNGRQELGCPPELFRQVVKTAFNQRRKTLRNSLKPLLGKGAEICSDHIFDRRPEQLDVEAFIRLTQLVEQEIKK
ncbi:MAG: 16S rRNA (adenine(1518)-N(6)/adenine(1519)-N(6))-dimethyltransferase RsmA [Bacteroidales bacterium]|nr:16S rRNA (adenine(1518)-N(6)/adenine(1519)-N(6))-dimethyltransferase RsmA [Bacteroidales bacterium]